MLLALLVFERQARKIRHNHHSRNRRFAQPEFAGEIQGTARAEETGEFDIGAGVVLLGARTAVLLRYFNKKKKGAYAN